MTITMKKFGTVLTSRQSGREAYAAFQSTLTELARDEDLVLDFEGVTVLAPSWADEFLTPLLDALAERLVVTSTDNASVALTIETLEGILKRPFVVR